jgi:hypothetical protein
LKIGAYPLALILAVIGLAVPRQFSWGAEPTPTPAQGAGGQVINATTGEPAPGGLQVMLHMWTEDYEDRGMIHSETQADGSFTFPEAPLLPGISYAVMAVYQGAAYVSPPQQVGEEGTLEPFVVQIYEMSPDPSAVSIPSMHVLLDYAQGGLLVAELYVFSNAGNTSLGGAVELADGEQATLRFELPPGAANVMFPGSPAGRLRPVEGGFALLEPIGPGENSAQVMVRYVLPYEGETVLRHAVPLPVEEVNVMVRHGTGLEVDLPDSAYAGLQRVGEGQVFGRYVLDPMAAGQALELPIKGLPELPVALEEPAAAQAADGPSATAFGLGLAGLAALVAGLWLWRSGAEEETEIAAEDGLAAEVDPPVDGQSGEASRD